MSDGNLFSINLDNAKTFVNVRRYENQNKKRKSMSHYNILRTEKVKDRAKITMAAEHNFRIRSQENITPERSKNNKILVNSLNVDTTKASDLQEKLSTFYNGLGVKEKKNNVLMMEFVVSASPEFFKSASVETKSDWVSEQLAFMKNEFGEQLKLAVLHVDERTPHIHFMIGTEQNTIKKYKNQKGEFFKKTWSLNVDRYNPEYLTGLHDRHAAWNKKFNLKRGVKGSMRKHTDLKEFYKVVNKAMSADYGHKIEKIIDTLETGFLSNSVTLDEIREKFKPLINAVLKENKALREKYKLELQEWARNISEAKQELKEQKEALAADFEEVQNKRHVYAEAINRMQVDAKVIKELESENQKLKTENSSLKARLAPEIGKGAFKQDRKGLSL